MRSAVFYSYLAFQSVALIAFLGLGIYILAAGWQKTWCEHVLGNYSFDSKSDCEGWTKDMLIVTLCVVTVLGVVVNFPIMQVLYYGRKEVEENKNSSII